MLRWKADLPRGGSLQGVQKIREEDAHGTWSVDCANCGRLTHYQKEEPVICPQCHNADIDTAPGLGE